jgi:hypothetical protein
MKKTLFAITAFVSLVIFSSSCKKDTVTNTVTDHDTTVLHDTTVMTDSIRLLDSIKLSDIQILTSHTWEIQEEDYDNAGYITQYIRDSINTTGYNQDTLRLTFDSSGIGTYIDATGNFWNTTWSFIPASGSYDSYLSLQLDGGPGFTWSAINISDSAFDETTNAATLISARWVPAP